MYHASLYATYIYNCMQEYHSITLLDADISYYSLHSYNTAMPNTQLGVNLASQIFWFWLSVWNANNFNFVSAKKYIICYQ